MENPVSHLIKQPAFQWAAWYFPEIAGGVLVAITAAVLFGGLSPLAGLLAPVAIAVQEAERLLNNARVRHASARRRALAAAAEEQA
jgi:hypothetical protein